MSHLSDDQLGELLTAYADGEVDAREKAFVEHLLREDRRAAALLAEIRGMSGAVAQLPRHAAPDLMTEDIRTYVERDELLGGPMVSHGSHVYRAPSRRWTALLSVAAAIGMVSAGVLYFQSQQRLMEDSLSPLAKTERTIDRTTSNAALPPPVPKVDPDRLTEAPPSEATLSKFVDEVLALAEPEEMDRIGAIDLKGTDATAASKGVVSLGLKVADAAVLKSTSGRLDVALRKAVEIPEKVDHDDTRAGGTAEGFARPAPRAQQIATATRTNEQSWTMRVPMSQVPAVADAVLNAGVARGKITLAAGNTSIAGAPGVKEAVARVDRVWQQQQVALRAERTQEQAENMTVAAAPPALTDQVATKPGGPFVELFKIMGVPESVTFVGPPAPAGAPGDTSMALADEERVAVGRAEDSDASSVANQPMESKDEAASAGAPDKSTARADAAKAKSDVAPGIVERQMGRLREAAPRREEPVSMHAKRAASPAPSAQLEEKYVTLTITLAVSPDAKPDAPAGNGATGGAKPTLPSDRPTSR